MIFINPDILPRPDAHQTAILKHVADEVMDTRTISVTDFVRPGVTPRNYYSFARYYHPDPQTPDGMPWRAHDGVVNMDADLGPKRAMRKIIKNVFILSVAGYFIDKKYAVRAVEFLHRWFLDAEHGMNPNLDNAQMVPGVNMGRPAGIIDAHIWINIVVAMDFLSKRIDNKLFFDGMRNWFGNYADWLMFSAAGVAARNIGNNISAWYMAMLGTFALFAGNRDDYVSLAADMFKWFITERMDTRGCFYGELTRTRSLHYCLFHLNAMAVMAELMQHTGADLWHWCDGSGRGMECAFDFLMPFISGKQYWPHQQIVTEDFPQQFSFYFGATRYGRHEFLDVNNALSRPAGFGDVFGPNYLWPAF